MINFYDADHHKDGLSSHCIFCVRTSSVKRNSEVRLECKTLVYNHYTNGKFDCNICGFDNIYALTVDHINGGGNQHKKEVGGHLYKWLIDNDYPPNFQILCANCQFIKEFSRPTYGSNNYSANLKLDALRNYTPNGFDIACVKCGFGNQMALSIDHIMGNGAAHRREMCKELSSNSKTYLWLRQNNYPKDIGLQVLCMCCQLIKRVEEDGLTSTPIDMKLLEKVANK